jgi:hypothetical protein
MAEISFSGNPPSSDSKSNLTKVRVAPPPVTDPTIPEQDRKTWPADGTAPMPEEAAPGPGSGAPMPKGMAYGQMRTAKLAARAAKAARR